MDFGKEDTPSRMKEWNGYYRGFPTVVCDGIPLGYIFSGDPIARIPMILSMKKHQHCASECIAVPCTAGVEECCCAGNEPKSVPLFLSSADPHRS